MLASEALAGAPCFTPPPPHISFRAAPLRAGGA